MVITIVMKYYLFCWSLFRILTIVCVIFFVLYLVCVIVAWGIGVVVI